MSLWSRIKSAYSALTGSTASTPEMNYGLDASRHDDAWPVTHWQSLDPNTEVDASDLRTIWRRARMLDANSAPVRQLVLTMVQLTGVQNPLPLTEDEEWNTLALEYFTSRASEPELFDASATLNFWQAQSFLEYCAVVDGDVAIVSTFAEDGGAAFAFYRAPSIAGGGTNGVEVSPLGRPVAYYLQAEDGTTASVSASAVVLYRHHADPTCTRGRSELLATLRSGNDVREIVGYNKRAVKLSSSFGLVMTKAKDDATPGIGSGIGANSKRTVPASAAEDAPRTLMGTGLEITALPPGRELKSIADTRPSQQVMDFLHYLTHQGGGAVGLEGVTIYDSASLGSAAVRFNLDKLKLWLQPRYRDRERYLNRMWRHIIATGIARGHLRPCRDSRWQRVRWVPGKDLSIDRGRDATSTINLVREGLADADEWCLATTGRTYKQLAARKAENIAALHRLAEQYGIPYAELHECMVGATAPAPAITATEPTTQHANAEK